jgi:hypothetical protein
LLLELIRDRRLCGSSRNKATVVFDGYTNIPGPEWDRFEASVVFSRQQSADERIRKILEASANLKNTVVVSDDKEVGLLARLMGAKSLSVEGFIGKEKRPSRLHGAAMKAQLSYSQMHKINEELKRVWLENAREDKKR